MSAQPLLEAGQLRRTQMRLAMAVGDNSHYRIHEIMPRHFTQTAARAGLPEQIVADLMDDLYEQMPEALERVSNDLPNDFPDAIRDAIAGGIEQRLRRIRNAAN